MSSVREGFRRLGIALLGAAEIGWFFSILILVLDEQAWEEGAQQLLVAGGVWLGGALLIGLGGYGLGKAVGWIWDGFSGEEA